MSGKFLFSSNVVIKGGFCKENISLQTNLEKTFSNSFYIFLLYLNFELLTVGLYVLITFSMLVKFFKKVKDL